MKRKRKLWMIIVAALAVLAVVIVAVTVSKNKTGTSGGGDGIDAGELIRNDKQAEPADAYCCDLGIYGDDNTALWVYFDRDAGTFVNQIGDDPVAQGTFSVNGNEIITVAEDGDGNELAVIKYLLDDGYLLIEDGIYDGEIPDGNTFEAVVEKKDSTGTVIRYTFREDGTYTCLEIPNGTKEKDGTSMEGTYSREGNVINRTLSGNDMIPFYVYEGRLFVSYYIETDADSDVTTD